MKNKRLKSILYIIVFVAIFLAAFQRISHILTVKVNANDTISIFYEEKDGLDVLFVGSSHAYRGFSPMEAWGEHGITSYTLGSQSQSIPCSYYLIKEGIRTQHPKVIVLEAYGARYGNDYTSEARLHAAIDGIPLNSTKLEIITELLPYTMDFRQSLEYIFPIITYHGRWDQLKKNDFKPLRPFTRGYSVSYKILEQTEPEVVTEIANVYERTLKYMDMIIDLCEENDVQLVLCQTPCAQGKEYKSIQKKTNGLREYVSQKGIPYINFELLRKEINLDYANDFMDNTHVNSYGAAKITKYISDYLVENYQLPDHRGEAAYANWEKDYADYTAYVEEKKSAAKSGETGPAEGEENA